MRKRVFKSRQKSYIKNRNKLRLFFNFFSKKTVRGHKRDYSWKGNMSNPYERKQPVSLRKKIEMLILAFSSVGAAAILIYHPFFWINNIKIQGLQRIDEKELIDSVYGILENKKFFVFPSSSYVFTDVNEIRDIIIEKYPIQSIVVEKTFPQTVSIVLEEKISNIIYSNGIKYGYMGLDGRVIELIKVVEDSEWNETTSITTTTLADGTIRTEKKILERIYVPDIEGIIKDYGYYPILYDSRNKQIDNNTDAILKAETVSGIINWFNFINKKTDIKFGYIIINNNLGEGIIKTKNGWDLSVSLADRFEEQTAELSLLLNNKVDKSNLTYIDLKFPGRAYWK